MWEREQRNKGMRKWEQDGKKRMRKQERKEGWSPGTAQVEDRGKHKDESRTENGKIETGTGM